MLPVKYELCTWGDRIDGPIYYSVDGMLVSKEEYYRCWKENQQQGLTKVVKPVIL